MASSLPASGHNQRQSRQSGLPKLSTQTSQNNRFSWVSTPAQAHPATFDGPEHTRPETIVDDSLSTAHEMDAQLPLQPAAAYTTPPQASYQMAAQNSPYSLDRKTSYTGHSHSGSIPSQDVHPALRAPYTDPQPQYGYQQPLPMHMSSPISTISHSSYGQHQPYQQSAFSTSSPKKDPYDHKKAPPTPLDFHAPYTATPSARSNSIPAYTPASPMGPNASTFHLDHQPTQPSLAAPETSKAWRSSTLSPSGSCLSSVFCPCIVYGRVQYRLSQRSKKAEPTDLLGYSAVNGDCGIMALACGLQGVLATIQRTRVRRAYGIEGDVGGDCIRGCCCCCCTIGLSESEMVGREEERRRLAGPGPGRAGYASTGRLTYMPPPR